MEKNYRSGSGSTSGGGQSMEGMQFFQKNQYYPRTKVNVSDITDQENFHSTQENKESTFNNIKVRF